MSFDALCEKIMKIDQGLRFVGVYNNNGELVSSQMRENTPSMLTPEQTRMSMYYARHKYETREHLTFIIGKEEFSLTKYEKVILFTIPLKDDDLLLVSADTTADYPKIVAEILKVIKETKKL